MSRKRKLFDNFIRGLVVYLGFPSILQKLISKDGKRRILQDYFRAVEEEGNSQDLVRFLLDHFEKKDYNAETGKFFKTTEEEVGPIIDQFPLLKSFRVYFISLYAKKRREAGLQE